MNIIDKNIDFATSTEGVWTYDSINREYSTLQYNTGSVTVSASGTVGDMVQIGSDIVLPNGLNAATIKKLQVALGIGSAGGCFPFVLWVNQTTLRFMVRNTYTQSSQTIDSPFTFSVTVA